MSVSRAYAKALYEAALEAKASPADFDRIEQQLNTVTSLMMQSKDVRVLLTTAALGSKEKVAVVTALSNKLDISGIFSQFLILVARKERLALIPEVAEILPQIRLESKGGTIGQVVSADALDPKDVQDLARSFTQKLGKQVELRPMIDPTLLAGIKVTVNGITYDGTLRSQLQQLRDRLVYGTTSSVN
jgi:F-type H+-transporting ATPase subunit delta